MSQFSPCIIIPSYINSEARAKKVIQCINHLAYLFAIPVYVLAQDWDDKYTTQVIPDVVHLIRRPKLGITHARKELRKWVLENTDHTDFILCDDDCDIVYVGTIQDGRLAAQRFLLTMQNHPDGFSLVRWPFFLSLMTVSRYVFERVDFPDLSVMEWEGYPEGSEDLGFTVECNCRFFDRRFYISSGLFECRNDQDQHNISTWNNNFTLKDRVRVLDETLEYFMKQSWIFPLPDNELTYTQLASNTFILWSTYLREHTVKSVFGITD